MLGFQKHNISRNDRDESTGSGGISIPHGEHRHTAKKRLICLQVCFLLAVVFRRGRTPRSQRHILRAG
jgi:hypothetical protein